MLLGTFLLRHLGLRKHISQLLVPAFKLLEKKLVSAHEPSHPELSPAPSLVLRGVSFSDFQVQVGLGAADHHDALEQACGCLSSSALMAFHKEY